MTSLYSHPVKRGEENATVRPTIIPLSLTGRATGIRHSTGSKTDVNGSPAYRGTPILDQDLRDFTKLAIIFGQPAWSKFNRGEKFTGYLFLLCGKGVDKPETWPISHAIYFLLFVQFYHLLFSCVQKSILCELDETRSDVIEKTDEKDFCVKKLCSRRELNNRKNISVKIKIKNYPEYCKFFFYIFYNFSSRDATI